jgi:hypothetical protein
MVLSRRVRSFENVWSDGPQNGGISLSGFDFVPWKPTEMAGERQLEDSLTYALSGSKLWTLTAAEHSRLLSLCVTESCREHAESHR